MIAGLLVVAAVAGDIPPSTPPAAPKDEGVDLPIRCGPALCIMPREIVNGMIEAHNGHVEDIAKLKAELEKLRAIKGCAKLEVTPKQPPPGYKKERDL